MQGCLAADIGGTKARFALVAAAPDGAASLQVVRHSVLRCAEFSGLDEALARFLEEIKPLRPVRACLAVAGPVTGDVVRFTNRPWHFSVEAVRRRFGFSQLKVINDVAALAYGTAIAPREALSVIKEGAGPDGGVRVAVAVGTGLGAAALMPTRHGWRPLPGESGHAGLSPVTATEIEVLRRLGEGRSHVAWESVLSGPGLARLHGTLAEIEGGARGGLHEREVFEGARAGDAACRRTVSIFSALLGGFAGDAALTAAADSGVYLGGGLLRAMHPVLDYAALVARFCMKGPMAALLGRVPVYTLDSERWTLLGAVAWLDAPCRKDKGDQAT